MSIKMSTNLDALSEMIGSYVGMSDGLEQKKYMDGIIEGSWKSTNKIFHKDAATQAAATNGAGPSIRHMYEYGTAGIHDGGWSVLNPHTQRARLWTDEISGGGGKKVFSWKFRPAIQPNPRHTEEKTGVAQDTLDELKVNTGEKEYVFWNRALVYETGVTVKILPKDAELLFVPIKEQAGNARNHDIKRGFRLLKWSRVNHGLRDDSVGSFSGFFFTWWKLDGEAHIARFMESRVKADLRKSDIDIKAASRKGGIRPVRANNLKSSFESGRTKTRKQWTFYANEAAEEVDEKIL